MKLEVSLSFEHLVVVWAGASTISQCQSVPSSLMTEFQFVGLQCHVCFSNSVVAHFDF